MPENVPGPVYDLEDPYERWVAETRDGDDPQLPAVRVAWAARLRNRGDLEGAEKALRQALVDEPSSKRARTALERVVRTSASIQPPTIRVVATAESNH